MNEGTKSVNVRDYYNNGYKEGFQKGKLEQKKEELKFLISEYFVYLNIDGEFIRDKIVKRIKQLQKEIGEEKGK